MRLPRFLTRLSGQPWRWVRGTLKTLAAGHLLLTYGFSIGPAYGASMLPTIQIWGEWLVVSKRHRYGRDVQVGDIVIYTVPIYPNTDGAKRVLGMPGDYVLLNSPDSDSDAMTQVRNHHTGRYASYPGHQS